MISKNAAIDKDWYERVRDHRAEPLNDGLRGVDTFNIAHKASRLLRLKQLTQ
jgi:hypothetical protein